MHTIRKITNTWKCQPTLEGAGVRLCRVFGFYEVPNLDPFLLLDDFHSANPQDYIKGFPWHPHRGIETVTYMISGTVNHGDSLGNSGSIHSGDVQWMTAGSGIIHQEMPEPYRGFFQGFQLWVNLPKSQKMMAPRYRGITAKDIPAVELKKDVWGKAIAGELMGTKGPVKDLVVDCVYYDIELRIATEFEFPVKSGMNAFAYIYQGEVSFDNNSNHIPARNLVRFDDIGSIQVKATEPNTRLLFAAGKPLREPVAWRGPIVMNTEEELDIAFEEYLQGTFIKHPQSKRSIETQPGKLFYKR
ncbi:MAG: pirin family protein [bacterium]